MFDTHNIRTAICIESIDKLRILRIVTATLSTIKTINNKIKPIKDTQLIFAEFIGIRIGTFYRNLLSKFNSIFF